MSTIVKAAAVQISPVLYSREGTVAKVVRKIHQLGQQGVQFATFPETVVPYYPYFSFVQTPLQNIVGPARRSKSYGQPLSRRQDRPVVLVARPQGVAFILNVTNPALHTKCSKSCRWARLI